MGTDKRERQKANRQARLAELERQQRRSSARKKYIRIGVIVVVALAAAFGLSRLIGRDSSVSTTDTTVPSDSSASRAWRFAFCRSLLSVPTEAAGYRPGRPARQSPLASVS